MQHEEPMNGPERELAEALGRLRPAAAAIDRDAMMFRAGLVRGRRQKRAWQGTAALLAAGLMALAVRPSPESRIEVVAGPGASEKSNVQLMQQRTEPPERPGWLIAVQRWLRPADEVAAEDRRYLPVRQAVLARGVDALPGGLGAAAEGGTPVRVLDAPRSLEVDPVDRFKNRLGDQL